MSFSSRRRNYLLTPHRRDGLIECMKGMLMHSFVLDALDTTGADTFSHFEILIDEHRRMTSQLLSDVGGRANPGGGCVVANGASRARAELAAGSDIVAPNPNTMAVPSRLKQLVPGVGTFYTRLPLRRAFEAYNAKYGVTRRRYVCISFNEIRHILNLAQIIAMIHPYSEGGNGGEAEPISGVSKLSIAPRPLSSKVVNSGTEGGRKWGEGRTDRQSEADIRVLDAWRSMRDTPRRDSEDDDDGATGGEGEDEGNASPSQARRPIEMRDRSDTLTIEESLSLLPARMCLPGPRLICFDGDQTLYSDGANFEDNPKLAKYLYLLLRHGVTVAVVTAAGYEYQAAKYELRLSGLLAYFQERGLDGEDLERFYIFGGECNYLLRLGADYRLHPVREDGPGGWVISTQYIAEAPGNWSEPDVVSVLDMAESSFGESMSDQNMRARIVRKRRSVGLVPMAQEKIPREALDEAVLRVQTELEAAKVPLPFCAFNGGRDAWVDVGNKRVGVQVLQSYLGVPPEETLHIGDQFLNTGNDFAARSVCPCVWITSPEETTYILKSILRLGGVPLMALMKPLLAGEEDKGTSQERSKDISGSKKVDFEEAGRRSTRVVMDVYTGEYVKKMTN